MFERSLGALRAAVPISSERPEHLNFTPLAHRMPWQVDTSDDWMDGNNQSQEHRDEVCEYSRGAVFCYL